ncbi:Flp family type IVb pilin [Lentilitoribacter sp. EG35]|uniref:Flp family type IVb pilin n=1 Tax=Lentilitoribacter sp. EG35 TaxID=3234192 RepID=UPI0034605137
MINLLRRFRNNERGATVVEYALIGGLISISVIAGATQMGGTLGNILQGHADTITEANKKEE